MTIKAHPRRRQLLIALLLILVLTTFYLATTDTARYFGYLGFLPVARGCRRWST